MLIYNKYKVVQIELPYIYVVNQQISLTEPKLKNLNELGVINKKSFINKFYEKYPRFYKEVDNEIKLYKDEVCRCKECILRDECDNYI